MMGSGAGGGKGGDQGEQAATSHVPDAEPGARVPGVDACTVSQWLGDLRWFNAACRHVPKVGAGWGSASRPDLCRGCRVTGIPTAIHCLITRTDGARLLCFLPASLRYLCYDSAPRAEPLWPEHTSRSTRPSHAPHSPFSWHESLYIHAEAYYRT